MATGKQTPKKEETLATPITKTSDELLIMYEETLTTVKMAGEPRYYALQKAPYIDYEGYSLYLSKEQVKQIRAGKLTIKDIKDSIPVQEVYKNE